MLKRRRTPSRKAQSRRKKRAQRTPPAKESKPTDGSRPPQFSLPNRTQWKALRERFDKDQLLPEDYPVLAEIVEFRYQLPELLRQEGMTVERLKELMGLSETETMADNEPNGQPSREADRPDKVDTCSDGS